MCVAFTDYTGGVGVNGPSSAVVAFAGGTFVVSSGAVICLLLINIVVSEKSRKLLGFLRKCVCVVAMSCSFLSSPPPPFPR